MTQQYPVIALKKHRSMESLRILNTDRKMKGSSPTGPKIQRPFMNIKRNQFPLIKQEKAQAQKIIKRVKSTEIIKTARYGSNENNILEFYKHENQNLKKQNKYLLAEVRKRKKNETALTTYIETLHKQIRNMETKNKISPRKQKLCSDARLQTSRTNFDTYYSSRTITEQSAQDPTLTNEMEELAGKFNNLMEQCSHESNKKVRNVMRSKLAETVEKMKSFRKNYGYNN